MIYRMRPRGARGTSRAPACTVTPPESRVESASRPLVARTETAGRGRVASRTEAVLRRNALVASLGDDAAREMAACASVRRYKKGEYIWRVGASATHFQVIVSGIVKLVGIQAGLRPTLIDAFGPGESLGYWAAFDGSPYIGDAIPITPEVETVLVPASMLVRIVESRPEAALAMAHSLLAHTRTLSAKIAVMCAGSAGQRLALLLLDLRERFGDEAEDGSTILPVPLSRHDLSLGVGATIETVIRTMSRWQKEGVLSTHDQGFVLHDVAALEAVLSGAREAPQADARALTV